MAKSIFYDNSMKIHLKKCFKLILVLQSLIWFTSFNTYTSTKAVLFEMNLLEYFVLWDKFSTLPPMQCLLRDKNL